MTIETDTTTIRYNSLPNRFLVDQCPRFRIWARDMARKGLLYFKPGSGAAAGMRTFEQGDPIPDGWLRVTVHDAPNS